MKEEVLNKWLEIEYNAVANKAGFIKNKLEIDNEFMLKTIRCLDYLSTMERDVAINYIITIIALMYEHMDTRIYDLTNFIIKILSRIGYLPSAIIVDENFNEDGKFLKPESILDMIAITLEQSNNQVIVNNKEFLLTKFQKEIWDSMNSKKIIGVSAPTSAGKSFVILLNSILQMIQKDYDIVYIVPTLSLVNQVTGDYTKMLKSLKVNNYKISNSFNSEFSGDINVVYILTQEKVLAAFSNEETAFTKKMILIVDEIQNIERLIDAGDLRAKVLYDTLIEFRHRDNVEKIVIAGPRIKEIDKVGKNIFGKDTLPVHTDISPVLNLTYGIKKICNKYYFRQYCNLREMPYEKQIECYDMIKGYGKKKYEDNYMGYLRQFTMNIGGDNQNIIFSPTPATASKIAKYFSQQKGSSAGVEELRDLIDYYEQTVSKNYTMCEVLEANIAYHHGKLPMHVRRTLEKAIAEKKIRNVVCTTTLMQGVNLPAQNVIIRNPHLYINKNRHGFEELSSYEMANLRGRSGRLLKDFIGRTYVLDESGFENVEGYNQIDLFEDTSTKLPTNYESKFQEYEDVITDVIESEETIDEEMKAYGYLVTYIRQIILRDEKNARSKLTEVGINLTEKQIKTVVAKLSQLEVPKEICYKNRYWDPFILNDIYMGFDKQLPDFPTKTGAQYRLNKILKYLRDNDTTNLMYENYIPEGYRSGGNRSKLCKYCIEWASEKPLSEILQREEKSENIEGIIELLERVISFNIPLLLKPIFDIWDPEGIFLTCMQMGAYKPITRKMIEIGIPRETAIYLNDCYFKGVKVDEENEENIEDKITKKIHDKFEQLPYWIKVQLEFMI